VHARTALGDLHPRVSAVINVDISKYVCIRRFNVENIFLACETSRSRAASVKFRAFWDVATCSHVEVDRRFRDVYYRNHQGGESVQSRSASTFQRRVLRPTSGR
jgi:hypothetical protein